MKIIHLKHNEIDFEKWDKTIENSINMLSYAFSWFLNIVSPEWEALIYGDYKYIMPLTVKNKFKVTYIVQPILTQQLGIFSEKAIDNQIIEKFIREIPYYSYELNLNEQNPINSTDGFLPNYILHLNKPYKELYNSFSTNTKRNIEKCKSHKLEIVNNLQFEDFIDFYTNEKKKFYNVDLAVLQKLLKTGIKNKNIELKAVKKENSIIAILCVLISGNRLTYLLPVSNETGKKCFAMFFLINQIIKAEAGNEKILDFEGSKIEGIARFYKGFGAINNPYITIKRFRPSFLVGRI